MPSQQADERVADLADLILGIARKIGVNEPDVGVVRLSNVESLVLRFVDRRSSAQPSEISSELGLKSGNTSAALRALEAKGLIRRSADPSDGRAVRVESTALAAQNLERIRQGWVAVLAPLVPSGHDVDAVLGFLEELDEAFHVRVRR